MRACIRGLCKFFISLLMAEALLSVFPAFGRSIPRATAIQVAHHFSDKIPAEYPLAKISSNPSHIQHSLISTNGDTLAYIISAQPSGFVIVSRSDAIEPVIAYAFDQNWQGDSEWGQTLIRILEQDLTQRIDLSDQFTPEKQHAIRALWDEVTDEGNDPSVEAYAFRQWPPENSTPAGGWIETAWHQDAPYNQFCPMDPVYERRSVTGCVATAVAQILNYHQAIGPLSFHDSDRYESITTSYQTIQIDEDSLNADFPSFHRLNGYLETVRTKYQQNESLDETDLAALNFACGVAVDMDYSYTGSGALFNGLDHVFLEKFGYWCARYQSEGFRVDRDEFYRRLKNDMIQGWPALISMTGDVNHALICDGYNSDGFYHINFGWGEDQPDAIQDVWYLLPEEIPDGFDVIDMAIYDIKPYPIYASKLSVDQEMLTLGGCPAGQFSDVSTFQLKNNSTQILHIDYLVSSDPFRIVMDGIDYLDSIPAFMLRPGGTRTFAVACKPGEVGRIDGDILVYSGTDEVYTFLNLKGYGIPNQGTAVKGGTQSGHWTKQGSPYYICGDISVEADQTLEIDPGVNIIMMEPFSWTIGKGAQLLARGSESDSIHVYSYEHCGWYGFDFASSGSDDTLRYCVIEDGTTSANDYNTWFGGAVSCTNASPVIQSCTLKNNQAYDGGAVYCSGNSNPVFEYLVICNNISLESGTIHCVSQSSPVFMHTLIANNQSVYKGSVMSISDSKIRLNYVTAAGNQDINESSGVISCINSDLEIINSILWNNSADNAAHLNQFNKCHVLVSYSDMDTTQGISDFALSVRWNASLSEDPQFADDTGYTLLSGSPCIDAADPDASWTDEPIPHGFRTNMGYSGGTDQAAQSQEFFKVKESVLDFGYVPVDEHSEQPILIQNNTFQDVTLLDCISSDTSVFALRFTPGVILSGEQDTVLVTFHPKQEAAFNGEMRCLFDTQPQIPVSLAGTSRIGTDLSGPEISGFLTKAGSPYHITADLNIPANKSLVIEPGVVLCLTDAYRLLIGENAQLTAVGTEEDSILFYAADTAAGWRGLDFAESGEDDQLAYCIFRDGKAFGTSPENRGGALLIQNSNPTISHCTFQHNSADDGGAICILGSQSSPGGHRIASSVFRDNQADYGGAIYTQYDTLFMDHTLLFSNAATEWGGGLYGHHTEFAFLNTDVCDNLAGNGGGFYLNVGCSAALNNVILWGNDAEDGSGIFMNYRDSLRFAYSCVDTSDDSWAFLNTANYANSLSFTESIYKDPLFQPGYKLDRHSPCVDKGDPAIDAGDEPFPNGNRINIGTYGGTSLAASSPGAFLVITPDTLDFGTVSHDTQAIDSIRINNEGTDTLHIIELSLPDVSRFDCSFSNVFEPPQTAVDLAPGALQNLFVRFTPEPNQNQTDSASLKIDVREMETQTIFLIAKGLAGTEITESTVSGIWTKEDGPYYIRQNISIESGKSLRIQPGTEIYFDVQTWLTVGEDQQLICSGSFDEPVLFSAIDTSVGWNGVDFLQSGEDDTLAFCIFEYGTLNYEFSQQVGGAIRIVETDLEISHAILRDNAAMWGGGIYVNSSRLALRNVLLVENEATSGGGAIWATGSVLSIENCTIAGNRSDEQGGAFYFSNDNAIGMLNSIVWDNSADDGGASFYFQYGNQMFFQYSDVDTVSEHWSNIGYQWDDNLIQYGPGNLAEDPVFASSGLAYSLDPSSPCVDGGHPGAEYFDTEDPQQGGFALAPAWGTVRNDMGAYGGEVGIPETSVPRQTHIPKSFALYQNYPNPFNAHTRIQYDLPAPSNVTLSLINLLGETVRSTEIPGLQAGSYGYIWDGKNQSGFSVGSGVYFCRIKAGKWQAVIKMLVLQ